VGKLHIATHHAKILLLLAQAQNQAPLLVLFPIRPLAPAQSQDTRERQITPLIVLLASRLLEPPRSQDNESADRPKEPVDN
jgi:hypothetical protein